jgi:hypothetical protein
MPGISRRRQLQRQLFARKLATGFAPCEPESLLEYCNVPGCETRFVPNERQRRFLALGKRLSCELHIHSNERIPRPERTRHRLTPREVACDACGGRFVALPRQLVLAKTRNWRLLCWRCCAGAQTELLVVCPVCVMIANSQTLQRCPINTRCLGLSVQLCRRSLPTLVANPLDETVWRTIVERSAQSPSPERFRQLAVAIRLGRNRRGKARWGTHGRVCWRERV